MEVFVDTVREFLTPSKEQETETSVATDAENGGAKRVHKTQSSSISSAGNKSSQDPKHPVAKPAEAAPKKQGRNKKTASKSDDSEATASATATSLDCGMCQKSISAKASVKCGFCDEIVCCKCSQFTPLQCEKALSRVDVLWACYQCLPRLESVKLATPLSDKSDADSSAEIIADGNAVLQKFVELQGEINCVKAQVSEVVSGVQNFSSNIEKHMRQVMNETLFGEDYPQFDPNISHKQAKPIAKEQNLPPPPTLNSIVKSSVVQQKNEEKQEDTEKAIARCNIIIYGVKEPSETDGEKRKEHTKTKIDELLEFLEVEDITPVKSHRLGKFKNDENAKPRPLKIILNSQVEAEAIVNNCKKLKDAPENLKGLSVAHDLTNEERTTIKKLVTKAKEDSAKDPNLDYKVVGPPWQPTIKSYKKREAK